MDIKREPQSNKKKWVIGGVGGLGLVAVTVALMNLKLAAPTVERPTIMLDTVRQGEMVVEVRGPGTLVPEDIRWITAVTAGRVEKKNLQPGVTVEPTTVLLELTNPDVEIQTLNADRQLADAQSQLVQLKTNLNTNRLGQASAVAQLRSDWLDAKRRDRKSVVEGKRVGLGGRPIIKKKKRLSTEVVELKRLCKRLAQMARFVADAL